ncbi:hypothetical protein H5410_000805 [Solanum commersonii]|uniref:Uncharacterized protein n=1 Tax=Solanum commersonii TaxID=4109 RepID=A0A9J6AX84_SOLCO|nr:hypothetical protein H5410_000805 [Solanum commersonii]
MAFLARISQIPFLVLFMFLVVCTTTIHHVQGQSATCVINCGQQAISCVIRCGPPPPPTGCYSGCVTTSIDCLTSCRRPLAPPRSPPMTSDTGIDVI